MADIIQLLPESIANQIAAGEVIQRPASAVKELLENAIDADSTWIQLIIRNAGKTLIQVIDNGKGMSETDARMCFERHATSKITNANDIFNITTKGFRGEALASVASIAQVELKTKQASSELATHIIIEGSEIKKQEYTDAPKGTSIAIKNLFFNVPARRKFLKADPTELKHITDEFKRIALAHPEIRFNLYHNDEELYHLPAGKLRQRIIGIFGKLINEKLIPIEEETNVVSFAGYIGKPEAAKRKSTEQFLFVNNRFIKSPYLNHAIKFAYENLIPDDHYPFYVLFLKIDPAKIDVNVHPTKQEIKFEEEKLIYNYLKVTVKHGLGKYIITPSIDFEKDYSLSSGIGSTSEASRFSGMEQERTSPSSGGASHQNDWQKKSPQWETLYADLHSDSQPVPDHTVTLSSAISQESDDFNKDFEDKNPVQIHNRYIISQIKSGMIIIDQQNAHERILYERYLKQMQNGNSEIQAQLFPVTVEMSKDRYVLLESILDDVKSLGFDIESFGGNTYIIRGIPAGIEDQNMETVVDELLSLYEQNLDLDLGIADNLARSLAKTAAIKKGTKMNQDEIQTLINELFSCQLPYTNPTGKKCFITRELQDLQKLFD